MTAAALALNQEKVSVSLTANACLLVSVWASQVLQVRWVETSASTGLSFRQMEKDLA